MSVNLIELLKQVQNGITCTRNHELKKVVISKNLEREIVQVLDNWDKRSKDALKARSIRHHQE